MIIKKLMVSTMAITAMFAFAEPVVSDVTAKQRYPWNGLVDITCNVSGMEETTKIQEFVFTAIINDYEETLKMPHCWVMRDSVKSMDYAVNSNANYRMLWDAKADLGEVVYSNVVVRVTLVDFHDRIQLWESGPYWATTNIGAEEPWEYGYYFHWGDVVGEKLVGNTLVSVDVSSSYSQNTHAYNKNIYTLLSEGWISSDYILAPEHDAASLQWGGDWRMPTKQDLDNLSNNCDWSLTTTNGISGYVVCGKGKYSSNSIFLPCTGLGSGGRVIQLDSFSYYWSSAPHSNTNEAWYLNFSLGSQWSSGHHRTNYAYRYYGMPIRPVHESRK